MSRSTNASLLMRRYRWRVRCSLRSGLTGPTDADATGSPFAIALPRAMVLVVGPGLLVVEDRAFGDPFTIAFDIQYFRLGDDGRERNRLLVFAQRIHTAFDQIQGALAQPHVDFFFEPGMWLMLWVFLDRM